jgi:hypothetical protein
VLAGCCTTSHHLRPTEALHTPGISEGTPASRYVVMRCWRGLHCGSRSLWIHAAAMPHVLSAQMAVYMQPAATDAAA